MSILNITLWSIVWVAVITRSPVRFLSATANYLTDQKNVAQMRDRWTPSPTMSAFLWSQEEVKTFWFNHNQVRTATFDWQVINHFDSDYGPCFPPFTNAVNPFWSPVKTLWPSHPHLSTKSDRSLTKMINDLQRTPQWWHSFVSAPLWSTAKRHWPTHSCHKVTGHQSNWLIGVTDEGPCKLPPAGSRSSMSFFVPDESVMFSMAGGSDILRTPRRGCMRIRPCQVDLFSRIAFPLFFIIFHLLYWSFHLAYLKFE